MWYHYNGRNSFFLPHSLDGQELTYQNLFLPFLYVPYGKKKQESLDLKEHIQETEKINHPSPPHTPSCTLTRKQIENILSRKGQNIKRGI